MYKNIFEKKRICEHCVNYKNLKSYTESEKKIEKISCI